MHIRVTGSLTCHPMLLLNLTRTDHPNPLNYYQKTPQNTKGQVATLIQIYLYSIVNESKITQTDSKFYTQNQQSDIKEFLHINRHSTKT